MNVRGPELTEELCGPRPLPVPNSPYGLCGREATLNLRGPEFRSCVKVEVAVLDSPPHLIITSSPDGLCGRKATLNVRGPELRSCVKVEVAVPKSPYGLWMP